MTMFIMTMTTITTSTMTIPRIALDPSAGCSLIVDAPFAVVAGKNGRLEGGGSSGRLWLGFGRRCQAWESGGIKPLNKILDARFMGRAAQAAVHEGARARSLDVMLDEEGNEGA